MERGQITEIYLTRIGANRELMLMDMDSRLLLTNASFESATEPCYIRSYMYVLVLPYDGGRARRRGVRHGTEPYRLIHGH